MATINFEERAIAFVDVLGFSAMVNQATQDSRALFELENLVELLSSAVPDFDTAVNRTVPRHLIPTHTYISDSIILSAPLSDPSVGYYNGLEVVIMRCIQLTHHLLNSGYLIRGGLEVGKVWHGESNIVGPGYQDAYRLEADGNEPRVVLGSNATDLWEKQLKGRNRMCIQRDGALMVNGLHDFYIPEATDHGGIEARYDHYARIAIHTLNTQLPLKPREKWEWFMAYLQDEGHQACGWSIS